ncbi:response regulator transcription factor [candidate division KSB1 bacterium]|nr:response regulator transcription factor [candidate division KSB1 bacterium]
MMKRQIKLLIADDHPLFLKGLREIIAEEPDWIVAAEAHDGQQAMDLIEQVRPDIAILDINMPHRDGLEVAEWVQENKLPVSIIILTMYDDELLFKRAAARGVRGYVLKESAIDDIVNAIESVAAGKTFASQKLTHSLLKKGPDHPDIHKFDLTRMERKIVRLIAEDHTTKSIAEKLYVSIKTVENHRSNICKKLNLSGNNALLRYVLENKEAILRSLIERNRE